MIDSFLGSLPLETIIHFEMASFVNADFLKRLCDVIFPYADSIGMNEQELPNLGSVIETGSVFFFY